MTNKVIAINTDTQAVEAIGTAEEVITQVSENFGQTQIKEQLEFYVLGEPLQYHTALMPAPGSTF